MQNSSESNLSSGLDQGSLSLEAAVLPAALPFSPFVLCVGGIKAQMCKYIWFLEQHNSQNSHKFTTGVRSVQMNQTAVTVTSLEIF